MPQNIIDKIWQQHIVVAKKGFPDIFYIDRILLHEVTSAQAFAELKKRNIQLKNKNKILATIDHSIPTDKNRINIVDIDARNQVGELRRNCKDFGVNLYDIDSSYQGIVHVVGPELGFTWPGSTIICGDSHTSTHGAFGAIAFGVGTSEITHALATNCILQEKPKTLKVEFLGTPSKYFTAKDAILKLIATIGIGGASGYIIEYVGDYIKSLSMEARMTICNMSIECGARAGLIAPDATTFEYLKGRKFSPSADDFIKMVTVWSELCSDVDASYDKVITCDIENATPMITWGINPEHVISLKDKTPKISECNDQQTAEKAYAYTKLKPEQLMTGVAFDYAFIGSCTNGRIEDLRAVARVLDGEKVAKNIIMYIVPGSEQVLSQAKKEGLDKIFLAANAELRMPGCSMCLAMNPDKVPFGKRCMSTTNRNFVGRQGVGSITHLASPETVAISAIKGYITSLENEGK
jgi:3-isopropylmalate/(R)-2-methylmalate dehydratase large subunit